MPAELSPPMPSMPTGPSGAHAPGAPSSGASDEVDPELLALPDPPRRERTWTLLVLAVTAVVSIAMALALRPDASYAFASAVPMDLGELRDVSPGSLADNRFVSARAMLGAAGAVRFERPFESDSYRLSPVAGRRDVWVEVRVPEGEETSRYVPPAQFRGRLVRFDAGGLRNRGLRGVIERATGEPVPAAAWLLVDGVTPGGAGWAVGLAALFVAFAAWNLGAMAKLVRRVR
jgi:hypothetical protein